MPEIEIRPAVSDDIPLLMGLDHHYYSNYTWQIDINQDRDDSLIAIHLTKIRLPRLMQVEYPWSLNTLAENWLERTVILIAVLSGHPVAYAGLALTDQGLGTRVTDLVVDRPLRRQGIGSALIWSSFEWALQAGSRSLVIEMQPKNDPGIQLARKLGFEFFGYRDYHYPHQETGFYFGKRIV